MGLQNGIQTPIGTTPYKLVNGKLCHLPLELEHRPFWTIKALNYDQLHTREKKLLDIDELDEIRLDAYESSRPYKERPSDGMTRVLSEETLKLDNWCFYSTSD